MNKINLVNLPTPINFYENYFSNNIYIKRDDLTDFALGGNKVRKLEYFIYEALYNNHDCIVTYGGTQSNHCRLTAAAASKYGLKVVLVLSKTENFSTGGNYFLYSLFDSEIVWTDINDVPLAIDSTLAELKNRGYSPYFIQGGGHGELGTHAYKVAYDEIIEDQSNINFDYIFLASGTGTTQAGLEVGKNIVQAETNIVGISVARNNERGKDVIFNSISDYCSSQELNLSIKKDDLIFDDSYIGKGYGDIYHEVTQTIKNVAKKSGIILDPVYTGKAFYGMLDTLWKKNIKNKNIMFLHTGGTPLIFNHYNEIERKYY
ncbi:1-aminocyclopropane-1-carboxylate deaminase/D-cysteine desulfhydrase [Thalassobacillus sp. CUG 92003]|uniref:1-aminocyclopropane-1-carboxylate deaminase/D-cysteine desulfhydrase n=1 Tax=Thalassobacillus sp. CUG 92003 TaxID=2736641 RepID=UPI0015E69B3F|nr:pyridoxal-phosphate dependent enzyme [Thalassobacillus sp. CUG 92003]